MRGSYVNFIELRFQRHFIIRPTTDLSDLVNNNKGPALFATNDNIVLRIAENKTEVRRRHTANVYR